MTLLLENINKLEYSKEKLQEEMPNINFSHIKHFFKRGQDHNVLLIAKIKISQSK